MRGKDVLYLFLVYRLTADEKNADSCRAERFPGHAGVSPLVLSRAAIILSPLFFVFPLVPQEYADAVAAGRRHVLLDVRNEVQFAVCALDKAVNIPLSRLEVRAFRMLGQPPGIPLRFHARIPLCCNFFIWSFFSVWGLTSI